MDPMYPAAPAARKRPTTVTVSSYLLYAVAALNLLSAVLSLSVVGRTADAYRDAYAGTDAEGTEAAIVVVSVIGVAVNILFAIALVVLALFNNRGRNPARITTWVLGGISLCCAGAGLAGNALTGSLNAQTSGANMPDAEEVQRRINDALPSWYGPVTVTLTVVTLLATLGALILLALPASNEFFRKPAAAWDPSMPGLPYPGQQALPYPGQQAPPYPGQPYGGQSASPYPGQSASPYPGQPAPPYPGQPAPPYPGQPAPPNLGQPYPGQPGSGPGGESAPSSSPEQPHTGSVPPTDPWTPPAGGPGTDRPRADHTPPDNPPADRPTDRPPTDPPPAT